MKFVRGIFSITRGASAANPYIIEELCGLNLSNSDVIDLLDTNLSNYYEGWKDIQNIKLGIIDCKLYRDIRDNVIIIAEEKPPYWTA